MNLINTFFALASRNVKQYCLKVVPLSGFRTHHIFITRFVSSISREDVLKLPFIFDIFKLTYFRHLYFDTLFGCKIHALGLLAFSNVLHVRYSAKSWHSRSFTAGYYLLDMKHLHSLDAFLGPFAAPFS